MIITPAIALDIAIRRRSAGNAATSPMPIASPTPAWTALDSACSPADAQTE
jgi:hypothetical protein